MRGSLPLLGDEDLPPDCRGSLRAFLIRRSRWSHHRAYSRRSQFPQRRRSFVRITNLLKKKLAGALIVALCATAAAPALAGAQQVDPTSRTAVRRDAHPDHLRDSAAVRYRHGQRTRWQRWTASVHGVRCHRHGSGSSRRHRTRSRVAACSRPRPAVTKSYGANCAYARPSRPRVSASPWRLR